MRIAIASICLATGCLPPPPPTPVSNAMREHRAAVDIGAGPLSVAIPPSVLVYTNRALLLWSFEEVDTATIELRAPHVPSFLSLFIAPVPAAFDLEKHAHETDRRIVGQRTTPTGRELMVVETSPASSTLLVHRRDLGVLCEATVWPDAADVHGRATLAIGARVCDSLGR